MPGERLSLEERESLRSSYRPLVVRVLFVGESPPAGPTFFYQGNSIHALPFPSHGNQKRYVTELAGVIRGLKASGRFFAGIGCPGRIPV